MEDHRTRYIDFGGLDDRSIETVTNGVERARNGEQMLIRSEQEFKDALSKKYRKGYDDGGRAVIVTELLVIGLMIAWPNIKEAGRKLVKKIRKE